MEQTQSDRTVEKLLRQQAALASFGAFAFRESDLPKILMEAARICASSLGVPFCKICRYRGAEGDLLIEAGCGWRLGVIGRVVSQANESSPQGRAYITGEPVIILNLSESNNLILPSFYPEHSIVSTVDVLIPASDGVAYGVLEIDSPVEHKYDVHDINFLTGFANVLAEAVATSIRNKLLRELLEEKNLLAEELQHRVRNNLQMVSGMRESYARSSPDDTSREALALIVRRVTALAQVYNSLLGVGLSRSIDLGNYLSELCAGLPDLQDIRAHRVELVCRTEPVPLDLDRVTALGMVVAELVANGYGHAFPERGGTITVALSRSETIAEATPTVQDDGIGYAAKISTSRRGLGLVKRLVAQAKGTIEVHSETGTFWTVRFPILSPSGALEPAA